MDNSKNKQNELLGVNKMGKNIKKSPLHQPNFGSNPCTQQPQPQPQVDNINKNDFRNIVQQLTGSSQEPRPPKNSPKPQTMRLQKIRPPPLTPINRPHIPSPAPVSMNPPQPRYTNGLIRRSARYGQPAPVQLTQSAPADSFWPNTAESPISAYMRYLQSSAIDSSSKGSQAQPLLQAQVPGQIQAQVATSGLPPNSAMPAIPSPTTNGHVPPLRNFTTPQANSPAVLPSPTSQFLLSSPSGYLNLLSPQSPYPLLSPGIQFSPLLTPNFSFSPLAHPGILGPGPHPPFSPGVGFPLSPSGLFPILSPKWRD